MPAQKSQTARSVQLLRDEGYLVDTVERWIPHTFIKKDLFGIFDLIAVKGKETLAIQVTGHSGGNMSARRHKIADSEAYPRVSEAGWAIELHGWFKKDNRWQLKRERIA